MAFKTDSIKLNNYTDAAARNTAIPSPAKGDLAVTDGVLQIWDTSWADVSGGGGGGGGSLNNVVEDTTPQLGGTLDANGNDIDMGTNLITDAKAGQWDTAYGWGNHASGGYLTSETHSTQNYTKNYTEVIISALTNDRTLGTTLNQKYVITSDPSTYKFRVANPATGYTENTIIEIINLSNYDQIISSGGSFYMYHTNTGLDTINDITIGRGQRGLITVSENPGTGQNYFYVTSLTV